MDIRKLQRAIVDGLEDVKAQDILVLNTEHLSALFERVIIASGTSNRQTKALASSVREAVKAAGLPVLATEGSDNGEWIIVDCGAAVAHIMQPAIRDYYRLEEIWGGKTVKMSLRVGGKGLVKASEPDDEDDLPPVKKRAAGQAAGPGTASRKQPAAKPRRPAAPAKSPAKAPTRSAPKVQAKVQAKVPAKPPAKAAPRGTVAKAPAIKTLVVKPVDRRSAAVKAVAAKKAARRPAVKAAGTGRAAPAKSAPRKPRG